MKFFFITSLLFLFHILSSQNLVPNPSFEFYSSCPSGNSQIELAIPWTAATSISSSDYYNSCSLNFNVPNAYGVFQNAHTGNAYAGFTSLVGSSSTPSLREYVQIQLATPLNQNKTYYVEFFVNLHDSNSTFCPSNDIAANFSINRPFCANTYDLLSLTPHIMLQGNPIINDTLNWVKIWGCYTAQGGEEYLTIGNFFDNTHTQTTATITSSAYYFVDDVKVEEITGVCTDNVQEVINAESILIYPNPIINELNIDLSFNKNENIEILIYGVLGNLIMQEPIENNQSKINLTSVQNGIYFYEIQKEHQIVKNGKLIITK